MRRSVACLLMCILAILSGCQGSDPSKAPLALAAEAQAPVRAASPASVAWENPLFEGLPAVRETILALQSINPDIVGMIRVDGTAIDYPVVQGQDNTYYLAHAYDGAESKQGAVFWDAGLPGGVLTQHIVLHAHNNKDGTMFSDLEQFKDEAFWRANRFIRLETSYYDTIYELVSVYVSEPGETLPLFFESEEAFVRYAEEVAARSLFPFEGTFTGNDLLLTLNTCSYEYKGAHTLVCARLTGVN